MSEIVQKIIDSKTENDIIHIINQSNLNYIKRYLYDLSEIVAEDEENTMHFESLKNFVLFLIKHPESRPQKINITPNCYIDARWDSSDYTDTVIMEFLPKNKISLLVADRTFEMNDKRRYVSKRVAAENIVEELNSACSQSIV